DALGHLVHLPGEAEPIVHEISVTSVPEHHVASSNGQGRESFEHQRQTEDQDMDNSTDLQALDLLHHPSYQERNNNRRRRRRRGSEAPSRSSSRSDRGTSSPALSGRTSKDSSSSAVTKEPRAEKTERRSRRDKTPSEPPEVVVVEMTAQEQDVYALMGISPLALSSTTVKTPKTAIVNVALPGEGGNLLNTMTTVDSPSSSMASAASTGTDALESANEAEVTAASLSTRGSTASDKRPIPKASRSLDGPELVSVASKNSEESSPDVESEDSANGSPTTRRRRRRSSAL
ncbi:MAG: hypothetical protein AAGD25_16480, partial [Cyanobacteria bacterium P01_F01_bin.150]